MQAPLSAAQPLRLIVTGATSFLGTELVKALLTDGHQVVAVCREGSHGSKRLGCHGGLTVVHAEMHDYGRLPEIAGCADVFIHLAWSGTGHQGRDIEEIQKQNIDCSLLAMKAAKGMGCRLFVDAGSQAEYGTAIGLITEATPCRPFSAYGKAKLRMKEEGFKLSRQLEIKYIHLRIFSLFGENDHPWTLVMSGLRKMLRGERLELSPCTQQWNFLHAGDAARQIIGLCHHALQTGSIEQEVYHIASKDTRVLKEFVEEMAELAASDSVLDYGAVIPEHTVSLHPSVAKTEAAARFISEHTFREVILRIINQYRQQSL